MKKRTRVLPALTPESSLKRRLRRHLRDLGFEKSEDGNLLPPASTKNSIRRAHAVHRADVLEKNAEFAAQRFPRLKIHLASGHEVQPTRIRPRLEVIRSDTWQSDLFRLATLSWSIPVSQGFGRRIRYLVWDQHNNKLIGVIALGDPVFNLRARDEHIGWNSSARRQRLVNIMDAYVLGAVPPYNSLLCGKLVACLVRTQEVRRDFHSKYGQTTGIISQAPKQARLVLVTTSSALGRSSVYNRLKIKGQAYFSSIGHTGGWGHFHVPDDLFSDLRQYLRGMSHAYVDGHAFGDGPNWRLRTIRAALDALDFKGDLLRHGIRREVFVCHLATNAEQVLRGDRKRPSFNTLKTVDVVAELAKERWIVPRAQRQPSFNDWEVADFEALINAKAVGHSEKSAPNVVRLEHTVSDIESLCGTR
ncbi:MAG: DUF4338 domain-containing protein [Gemmatimonadaceae bacterium]|nr:DUF4338 domain-containing protein [Gemmatimonadaceae bacterium]